MTPAMTPASPKRPIARPEAGFTLLEVMLAFAILSISIVMLTGSWAANIEKAIDAIDKREMRELADTVFGKILFEQQKHRDGDGGSMAEMYGVWARLPQNRADRYREFHYSLSKKPYIAAGSTDTNSDAEDMFGSKNGGGTGSGTGSEVSTGSTQPGKEGEDGSGITLIKFTMRVFRQSEPNENLIVLTRYLRPPDIQGGGR